MGLFSKLFGEPEPLPEPVVIPVGATSDEVIAIAVRSSVEKKSGNCATLVLVEDPEKWVQIMDYTINCHYPHAEDPEVRFPELFNLPLIAGFEGYDPESYMLVSLSEINELEIAKWIRLYFAEVFSVDLESSQITIEMEKI